ncbi:MAG: Crp/Fnr family transcriptional regulator [Salibacteraceae bacterium]
MAAPQSKLWYLERINLFKELEEEELEEVNKVAMMRSMDKGKYIYFPEEPSKVVFLLKEGRVKLGTYSEDGKEIIKAILEPGEVFGELAVVGQGKRNDFAQAMDSNVKLCAINKDEMLRLMNLNPRLSLEMTKTIGDRLQRVERRLESLVFKDARNRIIDFIKYTALEKGRRVGDEWLLKHNLTHQDLANLTATSRQTVTIVLNELREKDLIYFDRKSILIHDIDSI